MPQRSCNFEKIVDQRCRGRVSPLFAIVHFRLGRGLREHTDSFGVPTQHPWAQVLPGGPLMERHCQALPCERHVTHDWRSPSSRKPICIQIALLMLSASIAGRVLPKQSALPPSEASQYQKVDSLSPLKCLVCAVKVWITLKRGTLRNGLHRPFSPTLPCPDALQ